MIWGLHHVSIKAPDDALYAEAKRFYAELPGLTVIKECDACGPDTHCCLSADRRLSCCKAVTLY